MSAVKRAVGNLASCAGFTTITLEISFIATAAVQRSGFIIAASSPASSRELGHATLPPADAGRVTGSHGIRSRQHRVLPL